MVHENLPGLSIAVAVHDGIVWAEGFGWADVERRVPVAAHPLPHRQRFDTADGGCSRPASRARTYRRRCARPTVHSRVPAKQRPFSTRQVMGHVAGIHYGRGENERMPGRHCASLDEALEIFSGDPLLFRSGTEYRYSTYDWILVSAVVEAARESPFSRS
jgi:serine beta-lactamase-like protein LACTB